MKKLKVLTLLALLILPTLLPAQVFDGEWICAYATIDDQPNATGNRTISVASYGEDNFAALVYRVDNGNYYMVGYKDADSVNGRLGNYNYGGSGQLTLWLNGFDQVFFEAAKDLVSWSHEFKNLIFVANNDPEHNILVFEMTADSFATYPWRMATGSDPIWSIDLDANGRVYVTTEGNEMQASKVLIFESPAVETAWSSGFSAPPMQVIELPEAGDARGVTVSPDGSVLYVSNFLTKKVYCYLGDAVSGYTLHDGFTFELTDFVTDGTETLYPGPWGLQFMPDKNILFIACANDFANTLLGYSYGRIYLVNPNNGDILDEIDCAQWNYDQTGAYNNNGPGNVSGYAAPYNLDFDPNYNAYIVSYYGWTIDKWYYTSALPTIELTFTGVEKVDDNLPSSFSLEQNYPNPFNPVTTIKFSVSEPANASLELYSVTGELIMTIMPNQFLKTGTYQVTLDARNLSSGNYFYRLKTDGNFITKKLTLIK